MPKYDPEAALVEFEATLAELHAKLPTDTELGELLWLAHTATAKFAAGQVRNLLLAAYRAGKREVWGKAHEIVTKFELEGVVLPTNERRRVHTNSVRIDVEDAARADGVEL